LGGIVIVEREVVLAVGEAQAVELGEGDGLDDGEALGAAVFEVGFGFLEGEAVEKFPGGVAEVEEGGAVGVDEEAVVVGDAEVAVGEIDAGAFEGPGLGAREGGEEGEGNQNDEGRMTNECRRTKGRRGERRGGVCGGDFFCLSIGSSGASV
jgi:hypothetical protein